MTNNTNTAPPSSSFAAIVNLLQSAQANGLRYPKIKLQVDGYTLVLKLAGAKSKLPGSVSIVSDGNFENSNFYGRITPDGELQITPFWLYQPIALAIKLSLQELATSPEQFAKLYGLQTGQCCFCSRQLVNTASIQYGYGPICADKFGLPYIAAEGGSSSSKGNQDEE